MYVKVPVKRHRGSRDTRGSQAKFSFRHRGAHTGPAYTQRCKFNTARGPLDPLTTAVLDQLPGRAAKRLAPPGRLKRADLNKAHLHLGDLLPDPLVRVAHLRRSCELLRVVYEERLGARARPSVDGAVARARPFHTQTPKLCTTTYYHVCVKCLCECEQGM